MLLRNLLSILLLRRRLLGNLLDILRFQYLLLIRRRNLQVVPWEHVYWNLQVQAIILGPIPGDRKDLRQVEAKGLPYVKKISDAQAYLTRGQREVLEQRSVQARAWHDMAVAYEAQRKEHVRVQVEGATAQAADSDDEEEDDDAMADVKPAPEVSDGWASALAEVVSAM